ncbi:hypothetical protein LEP1GSC066_2732 [Leptospira sp. serovar Kenya str. Sh9]|nr:hypothetical protein LEP1GSC066_2732 [Leptospira sp. serovar Kenya str. Sh9]
MWLNGGILLISRRFSDGRKYDLEEWNVMKRIFKIEGRKFRKMR